MSSAAAAVVQRDRLLWRTRGERWDYDFILWPTHMEAYWWSAFHEIFARHEPKERENYLHGVLEEQPYVAVSLLDPSRQDSVGRRIAHYLVYLCPVEEAKRFPTGWGSALLTALDAELAQVHGHPNPRAEAFRQLIPDRIALHGLGDQPGLRQDGVGDE